MSRSRFGGVISDIRTWLFTELEFSSDIFYQVYYYYFFFSSLFVCVTYLIHSLTPQGIRRSYFSQHLLRYVRRTNKMHTFFVIDLIQLCCLSNNKVFIIKKTVQTALWYFIMHLYKQSARCQDVSYKTYRRQYS